MIALYLEINRDGAPKKMQRSLSRRVLEHFEPLGGQLCGKQ